MNGLIIIIDIILVLVLIGTAPKLALLVGFLVLFALLVNWLGKRKKAKGYFKPPTLDQRTQRLVSQTPVYSNKSRWIEHEPLFGSNYFECANCHTKFDSAYTKCPKCGIVMSRRTKYSPDFIDECEFMDML